MSKYFEESSLLEAPTERAAFSDRQAYVCAEMARLAYFRFEGGHVIDDILIVAKKIVDDEKKFELLEQQLRTMLAASPESEIESKAAFEKILDAAGFDLIDTFNDTTEGTQGFLCKREVDRESGGKKVVVYLAFRGTDPKDFRDIRTDIRAPLKSVPVDGEPDPINLHTGYYTALQSVAEEINAHLGENPHDQLIVCGHSLGGALGIVYTRLYASGVNGACYTFGAPPAGDADVQNRLKTPVYEIVNELDVVPSLPNPWLATGTGFVFHLIRIGAKFVKVVDRTILTGSRVDKIEAFIDMLMRYRHPGYVSYLVGPANSARLRYNLGSFDKLRIWFKMIANRRLGVSRFAKLVQDHAIGLYVEKLRSHAIDRNPAPAAGESDEAPES